MINSMRYVINSSMVSIEGKNYTTFGISGKTKQIYDVSTDKKFVEKLVDTINEAELSELHLMDVIIDSLA